MSTQATPSAFATNPMGMAQILLFIGLTEGYTFPEGAWSGDMKREPGDLGYRVMRSADVMEEQQIKELKNGGAPRPFLRVGGVRGAGPLVGVLPRAFDASRRPRLTVDTHAGRAAMLGIMAFSAAHFIPGSVPFFFNA